MSVPVVPIIMAAASIGQGIAEGAKGRKDARNAKRLHDQIPQEDPGVRALLSATQLKQKYAENAQSRMLAYKRRIIENAGAQTAVNINRSSGTSPGVVQQGQLRSQNTTQQGLARAAADTEALGPQYFGMQAPLVSDIADRKLSLQYYPRDQAAMSSAQHGQNSINAILGAMSTLSRISPSLKGGGGGGAQKGTIGGAKNNPLTGFTPTPGPVSLQRPAQTPAAIPEADSPYQIDWSSYLGSMISNPTQRPR